MAYFQEGSEAMVELEGMVDKTNIATVLHALAYICQMKADHLESNWQDRETARVWTREAGKIAKLANQIDL